MSDGELFVVLMWIRVIVLVVGIYFIPLWIALKRHKRNTGAIFALNLLAGWTFIGWVVALVWALTHDAPQTDRLTAG